MWIENKCSFCVFDLKLGVFSRMYLFDAELKFGVCTGPPLKVRKKTNDVAL